MAKLLRTVVCRHRGLALHDLDSPLALAVPILAPSAAASEASAPVRGSSTAAQPPSSGAAPPPAGPTPAAPAPPVMGALLLGLPGKAAVDAAHMRAVLLLSRCLSPVLPASAAQCVYTAEVVLGIANPETQRGSATPSLGDPSPASSLGMSSDGEWDGEWEEEEEEEEGEGRGAAAAGAAEWAAGSCSDREPGPPDDPSSSAGALAAAPGASTSAAAAAEALEGLREAGPAAAGAAAPAADRGASLKAVATASSSLAGAGGLEHSGSSKAAGGKLGGAASKEGEVGSGKGEAGKSELGQLWGEGMHCCGWDNGGLIAAPTGDTGTSLQTSENDASALLLP